MYVHGFRFFFTPLAGVLFAFPSRYWFTIGHLGIFSLDGWSRLLPTRFLVSRRTQDTARYKDYFEYEAITLFGLPSQVVLL